MIFKKSLDDFPCRILLLGSGELGREFTIAAKRLGQIVIAVDKYDYAPAMQVADFSEVIDMLDPDQLARTIEKHKPDVIVPEIEAIATLKLVDFVKQGIQVVPTAEAAHLTMNRNAIRDVAHKELKLKTAKYLYANSLEELRSAVNKIGYPCVVKPIMSSSGKGQSTLKADKDLEASWNFAVIHQRGKGSTVIVEEFIQFESEITLLTVKQKIGPTLFVKPIGHRQERGDYQESWMPAQISSRLLKRAQNMAKKVTDRLGGSGLFGVEFFVTKTDIYFSELSPRPHDTGLVTLISQDMNEFELHLRAVLGLPISKIKYFGASASSVILSPKDFESEPRFSGLSQALKIPESSVHWFRKPNAKKNRRLGVALARASSVKLARQKANKASRSVVVTS